MKLINIIPKISKSMTLIQQLLLPNNPMMAKLNGTFGWIMTQSRRLTIITLAIVAITLSQTHMAYGATVCVTYDHYFSPETTGDGQFVLLSWLAPAQHVTS